MPRINYDITATGGVEVARLFGNIAQAAKRSQQELERSTRQSSAAVAATSAAMRDLRASAEASLRSLGPVGSALSALGSAGVAGAVTAGVGAIGAALGAAAFKAIDLADQLKDSADIAGISTTKYQELRFALAGIGVDEAKLSGFLNKFEKNLGDVADGSGTLTEKLKDIDPALLESIKHAPTVEKAFDLILTKLEAMPNAGQRAALAAAAFGKGSQALAAAANSSVDGIRAMSDAAHSAGAVLDEDLLTAASAASDRLAQMSIVIQSNLMDALLGAAPALEAIAQKIIAMTGAWADFINLRQQGEKGGQDPEVAKLTERISLLDNYLENIKESSGAYFEQEKANTRALIADLSRQRDALKGVADARRQAAEAAAAPTATGPSEAERKKAQSDRERADDILADARRAAATSGLEGEARARAQAAEDIKRRTDELKELIKDEKAAADAIAEYKTARTEQMEKEITKIHADEAEKQQKADEAHRKQQEEADRRAQKQIRAVQRATTGVGGDTEASIWQDAADAYDDYKHEVDEGIEDEQRRAQLLADYWVAQEQNAQARILDLRNKAAQQAQEDAAKAAKDVAQAQEEALRGLQQLTQGLAADLGDALVGAMLGFEGQARSTADVVKGLFGNLMSYLSSTVLKEGLDKVALPALQKFASVLGKGVDLGGLSTAAQDLTTQAAAADTAAKKARDTNAANAAELEQTAAGLAQQATAAQAALKTSTDGLIQFAGATLAAVGALAEAGIAISEQSKNIREASAGQGGPSTAFQVTAGAYIAGFTAGGAAIGAAFGGVGAPIGAAVGAAVGTALTKALGTALTAGIAAGVKDGLTQADLEKRVSKQLSDDLLINVLAPVLSEKAPAFLFGGLGPTLIKLFTPSIERIFEKMLRQALGGTGGISTAGIPVGVTGLSGLGALAPTAGRAGRLIAEGFGAGGEAFGAERQARFRSLLLAATKKESERTGEEAGKVLAEVFVTAFQGSFMAALGAAMKTGKARRDKDFQFVAEQFTKGGAGGFDYQTVADVVQRAGIAPGTKATKAATDAVGQAMQTALANAADSSAFRKSLADSVAQAFGGKLVSVLSKSMGEIFAPFFSIGKDARREYRQARRRGDFPEAVDILTDDFLSRVDAFAKVIADPQIAASLADLTNAMLKLNVATAVASGDITGAADIIEASLSSLIDVVKQYQQLARDVQSRTRLALAGPGVAGDREGIAEARRQRLEAENRLAQFGQISVDALGQVWGSFRNEEGFFGQQLDPATLLGPLQEFAEARLSELEQEITLARQLESTFKALATQFQSIAQTVDAALGRTDPTADLADKMAKVAEARAAIGSLEPDEVDPEKFTDLASALSEAVGVAVARLQELTQAIAALEDIGRGITETLEGMAGQVPRLNELTASLETLLPTVAGGGAGAGEATRKFTSQIQEAVGIATARRSFFEAQAEGFEGIRDQAAIAARGARAQRQQLAAKRAELARLMPQALAGDADALARAQALSGQILTLAGSGARGRRVAREIEGQATLLQKAAEEQKNIATESLEHLRDLAETAKAALEGQKTAVEQQLETLGSIATWAEATARTLYLGFGIQVAGIKKDLEDFRTTYGPLIVTLEKAARVDLYNQLEDIKKALGTDGEVVKAIRLVEARLPAAPGGVDGGTTSRLYAGNVTTPTTATESVTMNTTVNLTVALPEGTSPARARQLGRSTASGVEEAMTQAMRNVGVTQGRRKVAA